MSTFLKKHVLICHMFISTACGIGIYNLLHILVRTVLHACIYEKVTGIKGDSVQYACTHVYMVCTCTCTCRLYGHCSPLMDQLSCAGGTAECKEQHTMYMYRMCMMYMYIVVT